MFLMRKPTPREALRATRFEFSRIRNAETEHSGLWAGIRQPWQLLKLACFQGWDWLAFRVGVGLLSGLGLACFQLWGWLSGLGLAFRVGFGSQGWVWLSGVGLAFRIRVGFQGWALAVGFQGWGWLSGVGLAVRGGFGLQG